MKTLWTRNFTIITLGTLISAIGGVAMQLALSLVVFDQTASSWLSGVFSAASILPSVTLPFFLAPVIDRCNKKRLIVTLDYVSGCLYLLFLLYIRAVGFHFGAYMLFSFVLGCIGAVYGLTFSCWYPDLIPDGFEQKGYSVSSMIYPLTTTLVTPLAAVIYERWGVEVIFLAEGLLLLTAATFEACIFWKNIPVKKVSQPLAQRAKAYGRDLTEGLRYLKQEKGIRSIYVYMSITNASGNGNYLMNMTHFQSTPGLGSTLYSFLTSAETIGRAIGAAFHYAVKIPAKHRYKLTVTVYLLYELFDGALLFLTYPVMLVLRFICGFLGVNTATLREAAVQAYLPANIRARVMGLFNVFASLGLLVSQLLAGALGEVLPYRVVALLFASFTTVCIFAIIIRNRDEVGKIYAYEKPAE